MIHYDCHAKVLILHRAEELALSHCWITLPLLAQLVCGPEPHANEPRSCVHEAYDKLPGDAAIGRIQFVSIGKPTDDAEKYGQLRIVLDQLIAAHNANVTAGIDVNLHFPVYFDGGLQGTDAFATAVLCRAGMEDQNVCRNRNYSLWRSFQITEDTQRIFANITENAVWYRDCRYVWASGSPDPRKSPPDSQ